VFVKLNTSDNQIIIKNVNGSRVEVFSDSSTSLNLTNMIFDKILSH